MSWFKVETLIAAAHVFSTPQNGERASSFINDNAARLGWSPEFCESIALCVGGAAPSADLTLPQYSTGPVRTNLLSALLRLGGQIDLDRAAINRVHAGRAPREDAALEEWLAFMTPEIRTRQGGFLNAVLAAPSTEWIDALRRCVALRLEILWQEMGDVANNWN